jgi:hypothetical protein
MSTATAQAKMKVGEQTHDDNAKLSVNQGVKVIENNAAKVNSAPTEAKKSWKGSVRSFGMDFLD